MQKITWLDKIWCSGVFRVTDYESELNIQKLKTSEAIW